MEFLASVWEGIVNNLVYIVEFLASFIEVFILMSVIELLSEKRYQNYIQLLLKTAISLILAAFTLFMNTLALYSLLNTLIFFICDALLSMLLCRKLNFLRNFAYALAFSVFLGSLDFFVISIVEILGGVTGYTMQTINKFSESRIAYVVFMKLLLIAAFFIFKHFFKARNIGEFSNRVYFYIICFCLICYLCINFWVTAVVSNSMTGLRQSIVLAWFCMLLIVVFAVILLNMYISQQKQKQQVELANVRQEMLGLQHQALRENYQQNAKNFHDFKNHVQIIKAMLEKGQYDSAKAYSQELYDTVTANQSVAYTGCEMVDALLNNKVFEAKGKKIDMRVNSDFGKIPEAMAVDICTILANLIDNAIEACVKIENGEKTVRVKVRETKGMLFIRVDNTIKENPFVDGKLETTKPDKRMHGFGLLSVRTTAKRYDGYLEQSVEDNWFRSTVGLNKPDIA